MIHLTIHGNVPSKSNCYKIITLSPKGRKPYSSLGKHKHLRKYEADFLKQITGRHRLMIARPVCARVAVYYDSERPDLDNAFKVVFDCLQKGEVLKNDRLVRKIIGEKFKDKARPRVEIQLTPYYAPNEQLLLEATEAEVRAWIESNAPDHIMRALLKGINE